MQRAKMLLLGAGLLSVIALVVIDGAWAAERLDPGTYDLTFGDSTATLVVDNNGIPRVEADEEVLLVLGRDALGRVVDEMVVQTPDGTYAIEVEVDRDGQYRQLTPPEQIDRMGASPTEALASRKAQPIMLLIVACAPQGPAARDAGWPSHGTIMSAAVNGLTLPVTLHDGAQEHQFDLSTLTGAYELCAAVLPEATPGSGRDHVYPGGVSRQPSSRSDG